MRRRLLAIASLAACGALAHAAEISLGAQKAEGAGWKADGVRLTWETPSAFRFEAANVILAGRPPLKGLKLSCDDAITNNGIRCEHARFSAKLPGWGTLAGTAKLSFDNSRSWSATVTVVKPALRVELAQTGAALQARAVMRDQPAAGLLALANILGVKAPGEATGTLDLDATATLGKVMDLRGKLTLKQLTYSEPSGRYATDKLSARAEFSYEGARRRSKLTLDAKEGQAYAEPLFLDFGVLPLRANASISGDARGWKIDALHAVAGKAGMADIAGRLTRDYKPQDLTLRYDAADLGPIVTSYLQPFLIGTQMEGLELSGRASGQASMKAGAADAMASALHGVKLNVPKLGLVLDGLDGNLAWNASEPAETRLKWSGGVARKIPLQASQIAVRMQGKNARLIEPWRQPMLQGALKVEKLALRDIGAAEFSADFEGAVEPMNLAELCKALGWPQFGGTIGGTLPGLSVRDNVWSFRGALEAQVFDGSLKVENLRAIDPFGQLPRVTSDIAFRRFNLEQLTGAFSFGRITGRLDGEVTSLKLLNWSPVAFSSRIYTTPKDDEPHRISQRAIDNISAIGGGPTGVLSRGALSIFKEFQYEKLGLSCVLDNGVCIMDGVDKAADGSYYLVKGRLLPRIDVRGYSHRVSWPSLLDQLKAARESGGPKLGSQP